MQNLMVLQYILKQFRMLQNSPLPAVRAEFKIITGTVQLKKKLSLR